MEIEIWKDIKGFDGYQVSNFGRVRTHNKITYTRKHGIRVWKDRELKQKWCKATKNKERYDARVNLWKDGKPYTFLVARLVATAFLGESELTVNHIDGNSTNNRIENLEWISRKKNIQKAFEQGLYGSQTKKIILIDKKTKIKMVFRSMTKACQYMNKSHSYLFDKIKNNKYEDDKYCWEILN